MPKTSAVPLKLPPDTEVADIRAMLRYDLGRTHWAALVVIEDSAYVLYISQGGQCAKSGTFKTAKALLKYIRELTTNRFSNYIPVVDTLHRIRGKSAQSVVPDCYDAVSDETAGGKGRPECGACPFRHRCGHPSPEAVGVQIPEEPVPDEWRTRLKRKMKEKYR